MKKIKLLTGLVGITGLSMGLVPAITSCSCNKSNVELDESVISKGVSVKSADIQKDKDSTIELNLPSGKSISAIELQIGNATLSKADVTISGGKITIPAEKMSVAKVTIKSITLTSGPEPTVVENAVGFKNTASTPCDVTIKHRTVSGAYMKFSSDNGKTWTEITDDTRNRTISSGQTLYLRGYGFSGNKVFENNNHITIGTDANPGSIEITGSINDLVACETPCNEITYVDDMFMNAFDGSKGIVSVSKEFLPSMTIKNYLYCMMFRNCTNLTTPPNLPATDLAQYCYMAMFLGCTNLKTAPALEAQTLKGSCYSSMFSGCTNLKINEDGSGTKIFTYTTEVANSVYGMFTNTGGSFISGTPTVGHTYNWYN